MTNHSRMLRKILAALLVSIAISGCANAPFKEARNRANMVKNGMTLEQAGQLLGMAPTKVEGKYAYWQTPDITQYYGKSTGAIRFEIEDGRIVNVPAGGIFSPEAARLYDEAWTAAHNRDKLDRAAEEAERARRHAAEEAERAHRQAAEDAERARRQAAEVERAKAREEIAKEAAAERTAWVQCADKVMCSKVFALAQIYVTKHSDQKIQVATDTIIETYNPTDPGKIGVSIVKTPRQGSTEVVTLSASCKDSEYGNFASLCRQKRTNVYAGFKPFVESLLLK
jgi:hypothetical protein